MDMEKILDDFKPGEIFEKQQFRDAVHRVNPSYAESSINWLLSKWRNGKKIVMVGKGKYKRTSSLRPKKLYTYGHSEEYLSVEKSIIKGYPFVEFQMWELIQFNEFINHQIAKNLLIVEVENMLADTVFDRLHDEYPHVLFCPTPDFYYRHKGDEDTIVVLKLISEAPKPMEAHSCVLEKLLVDLYVKKFTGNLIERSEYKAIFEDSFEKYQIDESKLFRYARRRNVEKDIKKFICEQTNVVLATVQMKK